MGATVSRVTVSTSWLVLPAPSVADNVKMFSPSASVVSKANAKLAGSTGTAVPLMVSVAGSSRVPAMVSAA